MNRQNFFQGINNENLTKKPVNLIKTISSPVSNNNFTFSSPSQQIERIHKPIFSNDFDGVKSKTFSNMKNYEEISFANYSNENDKSIDLKKMIDNFKHEVEEMKLNIFNQMNEDFERNKK